MGFDKDLIKFEHANNQKPLDKLTKYDRIPIYPSKVQSTAFPERVYIFAIQKFILISIALFLASVILGIAVYYKTFLFKPNPLFIYYSNYDKKFKVKNFYNPGAKSIYHNIQILAEDFLTNWITNYYSIDLDTNINNSRWCNCFEEQNKTKNITNDSSCSVCLEADRNIYNVFFEFVKPVLEARQESGIVRLVKILKVEPFFYGLINHNKAKQSILEEIALTSIEAFKDSLHQTEEKITPFRSYMFYIKVDFMTVDFKNGYHINTEFFTSNNTVSLRLFQNESGHLGINKNWIKQFKILEHSTNFILHNKYKSIDITDIYKKYNYMISNSITNLTESNNNIDIKIINNDQNHTDTKYIIKKNKKRIKTRRKTKKIKIKSLAASKSQSENKQ